MTSTDAGAATQPGYELDRSLLLDLREDGAWATYTSQRFGNRFGPYGGWIAALLMKAILAQQPHGEPLSLTVTFLGGCKDGPLTGTTRLLRRSRTNEHWVAEFRDTSDLVAHAVATFGVRRKTIPVGDLPPPQPAPEPSTVEPRPMFDKGPPFLNRYDVRLIDGKPFRKNPTSFNRIWVRDMDERPLDYVGLAAHADAPMPRVFLMTGEPTATATMSMTIYFHATPEALAEAGGDYILVEAEGRAGHEGFHDQSARLWTRSGKLLATTEQLVWYNVKPETAA